MPVIKPDLFFNQVEPMIPAMQKHDLDVKFFFSKTAEQYLENCKKGKIDLTYATLAYANILIKRYGFIPLLTSKNISQSVIYSNNKADFSPVNMKRGITVLYPKGDLISKFMATKFAHENNLKLLKKSSSDHVIYSVLDNENSVGVTMNNELDLLSPQFKGVMYIHKSQNYGRLYLLMSPKFKAKKEYIKKVFRDFHNNFNGPKIYKYLNYFKFENWLPKHKDELYVSDEFQLFLDQY